MLQAYLDDSGSHVGSEYCVLGGYFGGVNQWRDFERRWKCALHDFSIDEFHAKRFWARTPKGERVDKYKGWSDEKAGQFLDRLLDAIGDSVIYPFVCGVENSVWTSLPLEVRRLFTGAHRKHRSGAPGKSIFLPFHICVMRIALYCKPGIRVHFFFDQSPKTEAWATICYQFLKHNFAVTPSERSLAKTFGDLTFADSKEALPLQAADLLAYEANRWARDDKGRRSTPMRYPYRRALKRARSLEDLQLFDSDRFKDYLSQLPATLRSKK